MNLVGKIFIVLIFVMSLVFASFVVAVYATHKNWREVVMRPENEVKRGMELGLKFQLENKQQRNEELQDELDKVNGELAAEKAAARQVRTKLETENDELTRRRDQQEKELARLDQDCRELVALEKVTQEAEAALRGEVVGLREEIRQTHADRDAQFKRVVELTDDLHQGANQLKSLQSRNFTLVSDLNEALQVLRKFSLEPKPALYADVAPKVDGVVLASTADGLVEVSIGADDGLLKGHRLEVYRTGEVGSTYLGRIEVTQTSFDKAVCKIIPEFQKGPIQRGDRVVSKFD